MIECGGLYKIILPKYFWYRFCCAKEHILFRKANPNNLILEKIGNNTNHNGLKTLLDFSTLYLRK
jgi:hypothetical protein